MEVVVRGTKLTRLAQDFALRKLSTTLRRVGRRAIFEVAVTAEEICLRCQQRSVNDTMVKESLAEGITWTDLPQRLRCDCRQQHLLSVKWRDQIRSQLASFSPAALDLIVTEANRTCAHVFDLLGSGPTPLGEKIDWHTDFKTGHRWNPKTYYKRIRPAPYPGGYDIKVPWELSRCQHFVRLGQAYWITGDEKYAREFVAQVEDWLASNPWPWGVNWACTMDVAIRAVNWLLGYAFFKDSPSLTDDFLIAFYKSLLVHGRHIYKNLENQGDFTNNHYLADLVGLIYLGILCPEFKEASEWREFGLRELWKEMFKQVYPDGVSFEASIPYHRLVTEFFLYTVILCQRNDIPVPDEVMARLEKMLEFVMYYTRPDGTAPLIGDADNGRLLRLKVWKPPEHEWNDHRYLLAIGAVLFGRQDFALAAGDQWEEAIWLLGHDAWQYYKDFGQRPSHDDASMQSHSFPDAGFYVLRSASAHLFFEEGRLGSGGRGTHNHENPLGYELWMAGLPLIVDSGCYVYTADWNERLRFCGIEAHNTVVLDAPNRVNGIEDLFLLSPDYETVTEILRLNYDYDLISCLRRPVSGSKVFTHRREILFDKTNTAFLFSDLVTCQPSQRCAIRMHLGKDISAIWQGEFRKIILQHKDNPISAIQLCSSFSQVVIVPDVISPSYGIRYPSWTVCLRQDCRGEQPEPFVYLCYPLASLQPNVQQLLRMLETRSTK